MSKLILPTEKEITHLHLTGPQKFMVSKKRMFMLKTSIGVLKSEYCE